MTNTALYTVTEVSVSISGPGNTWEPAVSRIELLLEGGGIPTARLLIDPYHPPDWEGEDATTTSFSELALMTQSIHSLVATGKGRGSVSVNMHSEEIGDDQTLDLEDWVLTAGGLSGMGTDRFNFEIELRHPAFVLDTAIGTFRNAAKNISSQDQATAAAKINNPVDGLSESFKLLADKISTDTGDLEFPTCAGGSGDSSGVAAAMSLIKEKLERQASDITEVLYWLASGPGWPVSYSSLPLSESCLSSYMEGAKRAVLSFCWSMTEDSPWDVLVNSLIPQYDLTVLPTYWGPSLCVMPFSPWADPGTVIRESDLAISLEYPGVDPRPVGGALVQTRIPKIVPDVSWFPPGEKVPQDTLHDVAYIPEAYSDADKGGGYLVKLSEPLWLTRTMQDEKELLETSPLKKNKDRDAVSGEDTWHNMSPGKQAGFTETLQFDPALVAGAAQAYAKASFMGAFKANSDISFTTRLMITSKDSAWGNRPIPATVARLTTDEGKTILDFYVTRIRHIIDAGKSEAYTQWYGTYCRADGAYDKIVKTGDYNPLYTKGS